MDIGNISEMLKLNLSICYLIIHQFLKLTSTHLNHQQIIYQIIPVGMSYIEDFIHKLNLIPPQADKLLRTIRTLDKQVELIKIQLESKKEQFLEMLRRWNQKRTAKGKQQLEAQYKTIIELESSMESKAKEKINIAEKLYTLIHEPTEKLDRQLHQRGLDNFLQDEDSTYKRKKGKKIMKNTLKNHEWQYDHNEPKYCYCGRPSYGQMVMCQNTYCDLEWFHLQCLDEKKLPQKWFCKRCRVKEVMAPAVKNKYKSK